MSVYLDYNASAPLRSEAAAAMRPWLNEHAGNASSAHAFGQAARAAVDTARRRVAGFLVADPHDLMFTGSGTESVVTAVLGAARAAAPLRPGHVVLSAVEHRAGRDAGLALEAAGWDVTWVVPGPGGVVGADAVRAALRPATVLVSLIHANNETGVIQPVAEVAAACRARGILVHTDAVQSAGKIPVTVSELGVDLISLAAHKIGGPQGVGALWVRRGVGLEPVIPGAQEAGRRGGTHNTAGIVGFGTAAEAAIRDLPAEAVRVTALRDRLERAVGDSVPGARVVGHEAPRLPNTTLFVFSPQAGTDLVPALDMAGYAVSAGSACASGATEPSPVLLAMGVSEPAARTAVRVSLGRGTTASQVDGFAAALTGLLAAKAAS